MNHARYSAGAIVLHWAIAIAVIVNWRIAEGAEHLPRPEKMELMNQHKALGIIILLLTLLRLGWRFFKRPPELSTAMQPWERMLAKTVHIVFYVLLIGLPLGGWLGNSMFGQAIDVFGIFTLPALPVSQNMEAGGAIFDVHASLGTLFLLLIALHIAGALKHTFYDKDGNLWRMLPFGKAG